MSSHTGPHTKLTASAIQQRKTSGEKIVVLTAYDVAFARLADRSGADVVLVGDSVAMVFQGQPHTLGVTIEDMAYHARAVSRGLARAHLVVDMPFMSYQVSVEDGMRAAGRLVREGGAEAVKVEGGSEIAPLVERLVRAGIPAMGHVGLTPQSLLRMGGFKVQGRTDEQRVRILDDARSLAEAGAYAIVVEGVPAALAAEITAAVPVPTIGIGAGPSCDGQVLVMHDVLGLDPGWAPKFVRKFGNLGPEVEKAFAAFAADVRAGRFPSAGESYS